MWMFCFIHPFSIGFGILIFAKDEKEPKNLHLKKDFAVHRSPKG